MVSHALVNEDQKYILKQLCLLDENEIWKAHKLQFFYFLRATDANSGFPLLYSYQAAKTGLLPPLPSDWRHQLVVQKMTHTQTHNATPYFGLSWHWYGLIMVKSKRLCTLQLFCLQAVNIVIICSKIKKAKIEFFPIQDVRKELHVSALPTHIALSFWGHARTGCRCPSHQSAARRWRARTFADTLVLLQPGLCCDGLKVY